MGSTQLIWQGDSAELCQRFQAKKQIKAVITDPPFGVDNLSNMAVTAAGKDYARKIAFDESPEIAIANFQRVMNSLIPAMVDDSDIYVFTSYQVLKDWLVMCDEFFKRWGFDRDSIIIWEKDGPGMGDLENPFGMGMEFVLFYRRGRQDKRITRRNAVLHIPQVRPGELVHPHEKPLPLLELFIKASSDPGDWLVDPFGGSGSLARACRNVNRNAVVIEYDEYNATEAQRKYDATASAGMDFD
jgi:adenine-specific DNA-methyltransferase